MRTLARYILIYFVTKIYITIDLQSLQNTAISDRPKAKPVSKKEGKNSRKQLYQPNLYGSQQLLFGPQPLQQQQPSQSQQQQPATQQLQAHDKSVNFGESLNVQGLDLDSLEQDTFDLKDDSQDANMLTASILQQFHNNSSIRAFVGPPVSIHFLIHNVVLSI